MSPERKPPARLPSLSSQEVFHSGSENGSRSMPWRRATALLESPAASSMMKMVVTEKKQVRLSRWPPRNIAQPMAAAHATPAARLCHDAPEEEHGLRALSKDRGEGNEPHDPEAIARASLVDPVVHVALDETRVLLHPPGVPGEKGHRRQHHPHGDDVRPHVKERTGEIPHAHPHP